MLEVILFILLFLIIIYLFLDQTPKCGCKIQQPEVDINVSAAKRERDPNWRDLRRHNWQDFHQCSGQSTFTPGVLPTFGLWTTKDKLISPNCVDKSYEYTYQMPCPKEFPVECGRSSPCSGTNCQVRGVYQDSIKTIDNPDPITNVPYY